MAELVQLLASLLESLGIAVNAISSQSIICFEFVRNAYCLDADALSLLVGYSQVKLRELQLWHGVRPSHFT